MAVDIKDINILQGPEALVQATMGVDKGAKSSAQKLGSEIRQKVSIDNPRSVTESLSDKAPSLADASISIDRNITASIDSTGKRVRKSGTTEETRYNTGKSAIEFAHKFLDQGYDKLAAADQKTARDKVKASIEDYWPDAATVFKGPPKMADKAIDAMMETFLKDPKFRKDMSGLFTELKDQRIPNLTKELKQKFDDAKELSDNLDTQYTNITTELTAADTIKIGFESGIKGKTLQLYGRLTDIQEVWDIAKSNLEKAQKTSQEIESGLAEISRLQAVKTSGGGLSAEQVTRLGMKGAFDAQKIIVDTEVAKYQAEATKARQKAEKIQILEQEKQKAIEDSARLTKEQSDLYMRNEKAKKELYTSQADLGLADVEQAALEQKYIDEIGEIFGRSAESLLDDRLQEADAAREEIVKKMMGEAISQAFKRRWNKSGEKKPVLNKLRVNADFNRLLDHGPREVLRDIMTSQGMTPDQAIEYFAKNPEATKEAEDVMAVELVSKVLQKGSGVKLNEEHVRLIQASEWGVDLITNALTKNDKVKAELDNLLSQKLISKDFKDKLKNAPWKVILALLLGLGGAAFLIGPTLLGVAGQVGATNVLGGAAAAGGGTLFANRDK